MKAVGRDVDSKQQDQSVLAVYSVHVSDVHKINESSSTT